MSYARWGGDSDVYFYASIAGGFRCADCLMSHEAEAVLANIESALDHLQQHRAAGHLVPEYAMVRLRAEAMNWTFETPNDLLLLAYRAVHREGWEDGPTEREVWEAVVDHLSNEGLDPSTPSGEQRIAYLTNPPRRGLERSEKEGEVVVVAFPSEGKLIPRSIFEEAGDG